MDNREAKPEDPAKNTQAEPTGSLQMQRGPKNFTTLLKELNLEGSHKGQSVQGLHEAKRYLNQFGYLKYEDSNNLENDEFDEDLELAIKKYQTFFHLEVTGKLDSNTVKQMTIPRCGLPDFY